MPKDRYFYLHKIEKEVLEGLWKLGWRYMRLNQNYKLMLYEEEPMWNGKHWEKLNRKHKIKPLSVLTPHSFRIQGWEMYIVKLVDYLERGKIYKIEPFLQEGIFNVVNQEKYLGGIT